MQEPIDLRRSLMNAGQERPFIVGGDVDKNPCFLPLRWAKLVVRYPLSCIKVLLDFSVDFDFSVEMTWLGP